jgi:hypothetical protein
VKPLVHRTLAHRNQGSNPHRTVPSSVNTFVTAYGLLGWTAMATTAGRRRMPR